MCQRNIIGLVIKTTDEDGSYIEIPNANGNSDYSYEVFSTANGVTVGGCFNTLIASGNGITKKWYYTAHN